MVQAALHRAQGDMLERYSMVDVGKLLDRQASDGDVAAHLSQACHAVSEESRQLVSSALDHAQASYPQHHCTFEFHSPRLPPPPSRPTTGRPRLMDSSEIWEGVRNNPLDAGEIWIWS